MTSPILVVALLVAVCGTATAGYADHAWNESNESEERIYHDCADWSGVDNPKSTELGSHCYFYSKHRKNWEYITTPTNWGYPEDAHLKSSRISNAAWSCVDIRGFDRTLNYDGLVYTDDPAKINYRTTYLKYRKKTPPSWVITDVDSAVSVYVSANTTMVRNAVTFHVKKSNDDGEDSTDSKTFVPSDSIQYTLWQRPNTSVAVVLENHSTHCILHVPTPKNITGLSIIATSGRSVSAYEKHVAYLKLNTSREFVTCDLVPCKIINYKNTTPYSVDTYILPYMDSYLINITLYTPFEKIYANVNMTETIVDHAPPTIETTPIMGLVCLVLPIYLIYRIMRQL